MTVQPDAIDEPIEVRRNAGLLALVAFGSFAMAAAYGWRAAGASTTFLWVVVGALAVIGVLHLVAWIDARAPLLVADTHGVRLRAGREWRGLPWTSIDRVELEPRRGVMRDGRIVVVPEDDDEELSLPMGLATAARAEEVVRRLTGLARDRTTVSVRVSQRVEDVATAALDEPYTAAESAEEAHDAPADPPEETGESSIDDTYDGPTRDDEELGSWFNPAGPVNTPGPAGPPMPETSSAQTSHRLEPVAPAWGTGRAVRADVTRSGPATLGMLALKRDDDNAVETHELRGTNGRVGLVIESAPVVDDEVVEADVPAAAGADSQTGEVVGAESEAGSDAEPAEAAEPAEEEEAPPEESEPLIGSALKEARERLHLTVDTVAERTRIRPHVIESMEVCDFDPCGGDFYARGHLRSLAKLLGIDGEELVRAYDETYAHAPIDPRQVFEAELATGPRPSIRLTTGGPNWAALVAVVLVLGIIWGAAQYFTGSGDDTGAGDQPSDVPPPSATSNSKDELRQFGPPTRNRLVLTGQGSGTRVVVRTSDGDVSWRGALDKGQRKELEVPGRATVKVLAGHGVRTRVNGEQGGVVNGRDGKSTFGKK